MFLYDRLSDESKLKIKQQQDIVFKEDIIAALSNKEWIGELRLSIAIDLDAILCDGKRQFNYLEFSDYFKAVDPNQIKIDL